MLYVTSDLHLGHWNVVKYCKRPFHSIDEHDRAIISNWNNIVNKDDTVIICGDFAFKNHNHYITALKGKKILILGNHDKMSQDCLKNFTAVYPGLYRTRIENQDVTFCHYAMQTWASSCHGSFLVYGHSHGRIKEFEDKFSFDCGIDVWNYTPVSWDMVKYVMSKKIKKKFQDSFESEENVKINRERNLKYIEELKSVIPGKYTEKEQRKVNSLIDDACQAEEEFDIDELERS